MQIHTTSPCPICTSVDQPSTHTDMQPKAFDWNIPLNMGRHYLLFSKVCRILMEKWQEALQVIWPFSLSIAKGYFYINIATLFANSSFGQFARKLCRQKLHLLDFNKHANFCHKLFVPFTQFNDKAMLHNKCTERKETFDWIWEDIIFIITYSLFTEKYIQAFNIYNEALNWQELL